MNRPIDRYRYPEHDIRFGKIRVNFDKVEVDLDENYYTANQVNKLFVKKEDAEKEHIKLIESITNVDIKTKDNKNSIDDLKESLGDYVLKEEGKSLIPNDKLSLIDENARDIENLDTRVSTNEENISSLTDSVNSINDSIDVINGSETTENSIRNIAKYYVDNTTHVSIKYVETLPEAGEAKYIYVTPSDKEGVYKQYIWNNKWIELDNTEIDLSDYYTSDEVNELIKPLNDYLTEEKKSDINNAIEISKEKHVKQVDLNSYEGADGEVVQHIGNDEKYVEGHLYKKGTENISTSVTLPAGTITNVDSDGNIVYFTEKRALSVPILYVTGLKESTGLFDALAIIFDNYPKVGQKIVVQGTEGTDIDPIFITQIQQINEDGSFIVDGLKFEPLNETIPGKQITFYCYYKNKKQRLFFVDNSELGATPPTPEDGRTDLEVIIDDNNNALAICLADRQYTKEPITLTIEGEGDEGENGWIEVYKDFDPQNLEREISQIKDKNVTQDNEIKNITYYLTEEKKEDIDNAIEKAHTQNTDSKLIKGIQSVEVTEQSIKLGHYAKDEDNLALALGNGTSDNHHNAMSVDWNGNMKVGGNITDGEGNILSKKVTLSDLAVNGRVTFLDNNGELITLTIEELRNILMWVGTESELDALPDSEIVEGRIYSTFDGTIKRR